MPDATTLALFAAACLAFLAIPGPSVFYVVTRSLVQGRRAVFVALGLVAAVAGEPARS
jgi:threonine/homoserine/homoserine lactone efflux protein